MPTYLLRPPFQKPPASSLLRLPTADKTFSCQVGVDYIYIYILTGDVLVSEGKTPSEVVRLTAKFLPINEFGDVFDFVFFFGITDRKSSCQQ